MYNLPKGTKLIVKVGGSERRLHVQRTSNQYTYPNELFNNAMARMVDEGFMSPEESAAAEEFCINLVAEGAIAGVECVNVRMKVPAYEHFGASDTNPGSVYLVPVAPDVATSVDEFKEALSA